MMMPSAPQIAIEASRIRISETGQGIAVSAGAKALCRPSAVKAPSMKTSPWAKLMKRSTP